MIRGYTNIEQGKTLAEILPLEGADMSYTLDFNSERYFISTTSYKSWIVPKYAESYKGLNQVIPCWSLSALLSVLPDEITDNGDVYRNMFFHLKGKYIIQYPRLTTLWPALLSVEADNPVDACVNMIVKLKEQNLL